MSNCKKLRMNLLQQDVYVRDVVQPFDEKKDHLIGTYISQDEVVRKNGVFVERTVQPYPITPDSVQSFADGTNYRLDVSRAVSSPAPGTNLGDVAAMQELLRLSPDELRARMDVLREIIASSKKPVEQTVMEESSNG